MSFEASDAPWVVCKFGGSSVATAAHWQRILEIARRHRAAGKRILMVCSALKGVTDLLERLLAGGGSASDTLERLRAQHAALASDLGFRAEPIIGTLLAHLANLLLQVRRHGCTPALRAQVMATGEMMSTRLGSVFLEAHELPVCWQDARQLLICHGPASGPSHARDYLAAECRTEADAALRARLEALPEVVVTQGFVAGSPNGETLLLGRGGSDTSAAYFAAKLQAEKLEIWTDVPGLFSANPHQIPEARLIRHMTYNEAEALALAGGKALHPRCLAPVRDNQIPLHIGCTTRPEMAGTVIDSGDLEDEARFSAISARTGLYWIEAQGPRPLDFLQRFSQSLTSRGYQVNALNAGSRALQAAIDPLVTPVEAGEIERLLREIDGYADPVIDRNVASLSLVGRGIDRIFHEIGPVFSSLEQARVHHIGQNSDMDVTLLLSRTEVNGLVSEIHERLLATPEPGANFGPTWAEIQQVIATPEAPLFA